MMFTPPVLGTWSLGGVKGSAACWVTKCPPNRLPLLAVLVHACNASLGRQRKGTFSSKVSVA